MHPGRLFAMEWSYAVSWKTHRNLTTINSTNPVGFLNIWWIGDKMSCYLFPLCSRAMEWFLWWEWISRWYKLQQLLLPRQLVSLQSSAFIPKILLVYQVYWFAVWFVCLPFHCHVSLSKLNIKFGKPWTLFSNNGNNTIKKYSSRAFIWVVTPSGFFGWFRI